MWKIQIPLPDDTHADVLEAFCAIFRYPEEILDPETQEMVPNPLSKEGFIQDQLAYYVLDVTGGHIVQKAKIAAMEAVTAEVEARSAAAIAWYDQYRIENPEE